MRRGLAYAQHLEYFRGLIGPEHVLTHDLSRFNLDFFRAVHGTASAVLRPKSTSDISHILQYCSAHSLAVVPQSGNTGVSGGNIAQRGELILSLSRLTDELRVDEATPAVTVSAGWTLEAVSEAVRAKGWLFPLDLGAKGSCLVGGNLATNAGGLRVLRYGSLHGNLLGMEAVLASGEVITDGGEVRKNNTGIDLKQLLVGSEGTLGVITKATILLYPYPRSIQVAFFGCPSFASLLSLYSQAKNSLPEILSAFEYMDRRSLDLVLKHIPNTRDPLSSVYPYYCLVETHGSSEDHDYEKLTRFLDLLPTNSMNGVLAKDETERSALWRLRETAAVSYMKEGLTHAYDFSLPISQFEEMVKRAEGVIGAAGLVAAVGHLGDANIHIAVIQQEDCPLPSGFEQGLYDLVQGCRGSISAEHGIGTVKKRDLWRCKSKESVDLMVRDR